MKKGTYPQDWDEARVKRVLSYYESQSEEEGRFIVRLSEASIPTRYPESLAKIQKEFTEQIAKDFLARGKEIISWIKEQL